LAELARARAGSKEALGQVLQACREYLLCVAARELDDADLRAKEAASDVVQNTFLDAHRDFGQFGGQTEGEFLAWLRGLLRHNVSNCRRRWRSEMRDAGRESRLDSHDSAVAPPAPAPSPSSWAVREEDRESLERALARLPDDQRQVLHLRYREERSFEEIGRLMNRSANAAQKLWARAVERLQQELELPP
jgi:RNA polymerase sigma-70 factor (ECF subfamily)